MYTTTHQNYFILYNKMDYITKINVGSRSYDVPQWLSSGLLSLLPLIPEDIQNGELTINIPSSKDDSQTSKALFFLGKLPELISSKKEIDYLTYVEQLAVLTQRYGIGDELKSLVLTMLNILEYFAVDIYETKLYPFVSLLINILNDKFIPIQPPNYALDTVTILNIEGEYVEKLNPILREYLQRQMINVWINIYKRDDYTKDVIRLIVHDICHSEKYYGWNINDVMEYNNLKQSEFNKKLVLYPSDVGSSNILHLYVQCEEGNVISVQEDGVNNIIIYYKINDIHDSNNIYFTSKLLYNTVYYGDIILNKFDDITLHTGIVNNKFINISKVSKFNEINGSMQSYRIIGNEQLYNMLAKPTFSQLAYIMEYNLYYKSNF
ncbi:Hypothetical protein ORPV_611 [Orpheovirus IHUMI-LCC2]|uniref:Uncharacterized protein n=1 Tax=Orpheovirus IHUMI-LCC2 TaxID=2023057 RepID=A0A2I2L4N6_9VIRU|nr:Hypothetical protein ORPV_611 [Orpheovirus IHUMI-LCC2]SNW62515.1 Hypothetical protein ORPV_611 [Orpheovirus IHUMI-LCC2]